MPLKDCIADNDKLYCWNNETGKIDVYTCMPVPVEKCPPAAIEKLMRLLAEKAKSGAEKQNN